MSVKISRDIPESFSLKHINLQTKDCHTNIKKGRAQTKEQDKRVMSYSLILKRSNSEHILGY